MSVKPHTINSPHPLPCVVQVGFAGTRKLFVDITDDQRTALETAIESKLALVLTKLPSVLQFQANHFLVGISQVACGADTLFSRACLNARPRPIPQRILLPERRDCYLSAIGSNGPDFSSREQTEATKLLASTHIIQEQVVSNSATRSERFADTNAEILRISDLIVCLLTESSKPQPGGTIELLERAKKRGTPVLEIRVGLKSGEFTFTEQWHNRGGFVLPHLPSELAAESVRIAVEPLPTRNEFCEPLKQLVSTQARSLQTLFKFAAVGIIGTHTFATVCATLAVVFHEKGEHHESFSWEHPGTVPSLLVIELLLLSFGFLIHWRLHHSEAARKWAVARVVAELARSLRAIDSHYVNLEQLFRLPLPYRFRFLLRTLNVLHLRSTWPNRHSDWSQERDKYVRDRLEEQDAFYSKRLKEDRRLLLWCQNAFTACSLFAILATLAKLAVSIMAPEHESLLSTLGAFAIVLPVFAVAGLSWSAALDCEARIETFAETHAFIQRQRPLLEQTVSRVDFDGLLLETELAFLGETSNWYSRRSNTSVA